MKPLTAKQTEGLMFCAQFFAANDQLPTAQAIIDHFGWASPNAAYDLLMVLSGKGYVERNSLAKWKFTSKGRAFIMKHATAARWFPTSGIDEPINGSVFASSAV